MKENATIKAEQLKLIDVFKVAVMHFLTAVLGALTARAPTMSSFAPFGVAFAAAMPKKYILSAGIGAALGYFIPINSQNSFRYFAAVFAVCTIRLLLFKIGNFGKKPLFSGLVAFAANMATSLASVSVGGQTFIFSLIESVLAFAAAFFIQKSVGVLSREKAGLSPEQLASVIIFLNIILLSFYPVSFYGISLGRILAATLILTAARYARAAGGAIAGCACSAFLMLCSQEFSTAAVIFAVGGMLCGVFSTLGKIPVCAIFLLWSAVGAMLIEKSAAAFLLISEAAFGSAICILLPSKIGVKVGKLFSPPVNIPSLEGLRRALTMRLFFASDALSDVSQTVKEVSHELSLINAPDFDWVLGNVKAEACRGCSLCSYCWERKNSATHDAILYMTKLIKGGSRTPEKEAPDEWQERCLRPARVGGAVVKFYDEYSNKIAAEIRIEEIRSVVSDQFDGISNMLFDLGNEFESCETFDTEKAAALSAALKDIDVRPLDCACRTDRFGRQSIELRLSLPPSAVVNRMDILSVAEAVCDRDFEPPTVTRVKNDVFIKLCEKANLSVSIGVTQLIADDGSICGDAYTTFDDGKGHTILLLSDGMGTGGRAAVDGAMASGLMERLLKAGFGYDCALRLVNSSLLFKSTDESLATIDIASIDLFTGQVELYKVGAAPTVLRRGGRTGKAQSTSLPAGILRDIGFDKAAVTLKHGDIVLLLSDGAVNDGTDWICAELEAFKGESAQQLSEKIAHSARRRRTDGHEDDITVMAAIIEKAI